MLKNNATSPAPLKPRLVVLTDISPNEVEPDDMQSLIRLLVHADLYQIEALIHTTGWSTYVTRQDYYQLIHEAIDLYEKDLPNLKQRSEQTDFLTDESKQRIGYWPSPKYLRDRTIIGCANTGMKYVGEENDSDGSQFLIDLVDQPDDRPIWITVWGSANTLAQAIWRVQQERSPDELKRFLHKLRVYAITDQDAQQLEGNVIDWPISSHQWMRREFEKDLFFIWDESAWAYQNGTGRKRWNDYETNIQGHGNLGKRYPKYKYGVEGDTPAYLHLIPNGLNDPAIPNQVGWGGYFEFSLCRDKATRAYQNHSGSAGEISWKYQQYFYQATFNSFAARMDWACDGKGNRDPVVVIDQDQSREILLKHPKAGTKITLDASGSFDPDGDGLSFKWWILPEAGTYHGTIEISGSSTSTVVLSIPIDACGKCFHVICEVTDDGEHPLTSYRRIMIEPR